MIDYKKIFKFILLLIIIIIIIYFLFFKIKIFNFKNNGKTTQNVTEFYSPDKPARDIVVYYGDPETDKLKSYSTKIYLDDHIINEVKQVLERLLGNPTQDYTRVIPEGTAIREVYIDSNSILYIDLSEEFMINNKGGTTFEYLSVYSIIKSIFFNFKQIRGIKLLINGTEQDTVSGHLSIIDIFRPEDIE